MDSPYLLGVLLTVALSISLWLGWTKHPVHKPNQTTCFRISGIPLDWDSEKLEKELRIIDSDFNSKGAMLFGPFPDSCGTTQTALLNLNECTPYFTFKVNPEKLEVIKQNGQTVRLVLDQHFYDLTPLNRAKDPIELELVDP